MKLSKTYNLAVVNPVLSKEWHPTKNDRTPWEVTPGSHYKAWWKCLRGHVWKTTVCHRNNGNGCFKCYQISKEGKPKGVTFEDNLAVINPIITKEWHPVKNDRTPQDVTLGSRYNAWWKCKKCGYEWQARVWEKSLGHKKCRRCNSLAMRRPDLSKEWHPTLNGNLTPKDITPGSGKKVWWKCNWGHAWETKVCNRKRTGCPECWKRIQKGLLKGKEVPRF